MGLKPVNWSVVILGRWNRAILTPAGIAQRVFLTPSDQELDVLVPLDGVSSFIVRDLNHDISVRTDESRLLIHVDNTSYDCLQKAMSYGCNAMDSLPETPVTAAGFNVNYQCDDLSTELARLIVADVDKLLSAGDLKISNRTVARSFEFHSGQLGLTLNADAGAFRMLGNFHRASTKVTDLKEWLTTPVTEVQETMENLLKVLELSIEEP